MLRLLPLRARERRGRVRRRLLVSLLVSRMHADSAHTRHPTLVWVANFPPRQATAPGPTSASTSIDAFPLFEVLAEHSDYVQRVEPSVQGGRKIARAFLDELFPPSEDTSRL